MSLFAELASKQLAHRKASYDDLVQRLANSIKMRNLTVDDSVYESWGYTATHAEKAALAKVFQGCSVRVHEVKTGTSVHVSWKGVATGLETDDLTASAAAPAAASVPSSTSAVVAANVVPSAPPPSYSESVKAPDAKQQQLDPKTLIAKKAKSNPKRRRDDWEPLLADSDLDDVNNTSFSVICGQCHGTSCNRCNGGVVVVSSMSFIVTRCCRCRGTGYNPSHTEMCEMCEGACFYWSRRFDQPSSASASSVAKT